MEYLHLSKQQIMADPHWAHRLRQVAMESYRVAGSTHPTIQAGYFRLMQLVPRDDGPEVLEPLLKVIATMRAFGRLTQKQLQTLEGTIHPLDTRYAKAIINNSDPDAWVKLRAEYQQEIWASDPYLASLRELLDADVARAAAIDQQARDAHEDARLARVKAEATAPGHVLDLHKRGVMTTLTADGAVHLFPVSLLTDEDKAFARDYGDLLANAIRVETAVYPMAR